MKRITEDQFGLDQAQLDDLFSYDFGRPTSVVVFTHPSEEYEDQPATHVLMRQKEGFAITMYHRPEQNTKIDELSDELSFAIVRRWLDHGLIQPHADQTERAYV